MAAKTLADIEQHARELAGGEFPVRISESGKSLWVARHEAEEGSGTDIDHHEASFDATGNVYLYIDTKRPVNHERAARFVSLCQQLDAWIKTP